MPASSRSGSVAAKDLPLLDFGEAGRFVRPISGRFRTDALTLFSIFRDEIYFCSAFFDHYRNLGVEQFLIVDDRSVDGTRDFLTTQPDCVTLEASFRYGDLVRYRDPAGATRTTRAGICMKMAVPNALLPDRYVLYADADEFLVLPPVTPSLASFVARLSDAGIRVVAASLIEMFPSGVVDDLRRPGRPTTLRDLLDASPYFDARPLIAVDGASPVAFVNPSKSSRLFDACGLRHRAAGLKGLIGLRQPPRRTARHKTPILFRARDSYLIGSHDANTPPSGDVLLAQLHFVFTNQFAEKVERARAWRSHAAFAAKYDLYAALLTRLAAGDASFLDAHSQRFVSAEQLATSGLMRWWR